MTEPGVWICLFVLRDRNEMKVIQHGAKKSKVCNKYDRVRFGDTVIEEKKEKNEKEKEGGRDPYQEKNSVKYELQSH